MNTDRQNIDDLFRDGLADCDAAPSMKVWSKISRKLSWYEFLGLNFTNFLHNSYLIGTTGLTATALITGAVLLNQFDSSNDSSPNQPQLSEVVVNHKAQVKVEAPVVEQSLVENVEISSFTRRTNPSVNKDVEATAPRSEMTFSSMTKRQANLNQTGLSANLESRQVIAEPLKSEKDSTKDDLVFKIGFNMGYMQRTLPLSTGDITSKNPFGGLVVRVESGNWFAESGISMHEEEDQGHYKAFYRAFDSVGFYEKVEWYVPDPQKPDEVILITKRLAIWDSVDRYGDAQTLMNYRYLNIPFKLGYRFLSGKWYNLSAYGAGVMSLETATQKTDPVFSSRFYRVLVLDDLTLERRSLLWSVQAGMRFDVILSKRISWEIEPWYRIYTKSAYLSPQSNSGQAWGLNTGFSLKF
ncbi:MAG: hypothetical protein LWX70_01850 [Sphingobacteriia bacterium]|nr:hypothetical protein [Sphingobacteriia bacterium]